METEVMEAANVMSQLISLNITLDDVHFGAKWLFAMPLIVWIGFVHYLAARQIPLLGRFFGNKK